MAGGHENLIPVRSEDEARKKGRKGGIASGKARKEKKTVKKILTELLDLDITKSPKFEEIANKLGIESDKSIKELFVFMCVLNSLEKGNLYDIEKLTELLNEESGQRNGVLEDILNAVGKINND